MINGKTRSVPLNILSSVLVAILLILGLIHNLLILFVSACSGCSNDTAHVQVTSIYGI